MSDTKPTSDTQSDAGSNSTVKGKRFFAAWILGAIGAYFVLAPGSDVLRAVFDPPAEEYLVGGLYLGKSCHNILFVFMLIGVVGLCDVIVARLFGPARYFALHVIVNVACCAFAWDDALAGFRMGNPYGTITCTASGSRCANWVAVDLTIAHHVWHSLAYALKPIDLVHHIPSIAVCLVCLPFGWGPVLNIQILFLMGIPGGVDYFLLTLTKLRMLHPRVEKNANQSLNVWIRSPGAQAYALTMMASTFVHPGSFTTLTHRVVVFVCGVHHFWNPGFFMTRTVDARTRYFIKEKAEKEAKASKAKAL